jgi:hypothetical protein
VYVPTSACYYAIVSHGRARRVSFDANAWSDLLRGGALERAALLALRRSVRAKQLEVSVCWPLILELAGTYKHDPAFWRRSLRELRRVGNGRILRDPHSRIDLETTAGRSLRRRERLQTSKECSTFFGHVLAEDVREGDNDLRKHKAAYAAREAESQATVRREFGTRERARWIEEWKRDPSGIVRDWCNDAMEEVVGRKADFPDAQRLPTLWQYWGYGLARVYLVGVEAEGPRRIDANDLLDRDHYADSAYSTVLVTDDRKLTDIASRCPSPKPRLQRLREWSIEITTG